MIGITPLSFCAESSCSSDAPCPTAILPHMNRPSSLLRILGLSFGLAVTVGNTIGGGILRTPGDIAALLPNSVAVRRDLGRRRTLRAARRERARRARHDVAAERRAVRLRAARVRRLRGLSRRMDGLDLDRARRSAAISLVLGESAASLARPAATRRVADRDVGRRRVHADAGPRNASSATCTQRITSLAKAVALLVLVGACFVFAGSAHVPAAGASARGDRRRSFAAFMLAAQAVIYAYDGWSGPIYFSEELDDPARQIPRSMFYGLLSVAVDLSADQHRVRLRRADERAGRLAARGGDGGARRCSAIAASCSFASSSSSSLPSAVNACLLMASRVLFSVSRDGLGIPVATRVNARGTPMIALVADRRRSRSCFSRRARSRRSSRSPRSFSSPAYSLSFIAVFLLRRREPNAARPYRAIGHPWTTGFVLLGSLAFLASAVIGDRRNSLYALGNRGRQLSSVPTQPRTALPVPSVDPYASE